ncbi:hypothetical protein HPB52_017654 [Rhipicephalus sanguineus]|uniref:Uncharacterized protein n=1 Tax=Rhipicephalus sanguineus TaxID=34632 RepID=A0A9D4PPN1_RHISA|nr:hypothetical protein HPB52_017654 [Rhipicephalus sanguineus]
MAEAVLANVKANRWSAQNVLLASDGTLMREPRGPAQRFAFQCSAAIVRGQEVILCGTCFIEHVNATV